MNVIMVMDLSGIVDTTVGGTYINCYFIVFILINYYYTRVLMQFLVNTKTFLKT